MATAQLELEVARKLDEVATLMRESLVYIRLLAMPKVRELVEDELRTEADKQLYQACVGRSVRELAKDIQMAVSTVHTKLQRWMENGLVHKDSDGHYQRLFDLNALGLVPSNDTSHPSERGTE